MKHFKLNFIAVILLAVTVYSCSNDDDNKTTPIIENGTNVSVKNTFQGGVGPAFTNGAEVPIEVFFPDADPAALSATATVEGAVEFPSYLLGLYDIDVDENSINFEMVAQEGDATYSNFFRTIEAGSFDRYYLTFDKAHGVKSYTSSDDAVSLRIDSDNILVVQISEGYVFQPGAAFTLTISDKEPTTPQIVNGESVHVRNTFEAGALLGLPAAQTGVEIKIEDFFGVEAKSLEATATIYSAVEFPNYLLGLYNIDVDGDIIDFTMVAEEGNPNYGMLFRTIEAGSYDRYYLTFDLPHNVKDFTSSDAAVDLRIDSDNVLVVEIGEGFVFEPGAAFSITLK